MTKKTKSVLVIVMLSIVVFMVMVAVAPVSSYRNTINAVVSTGDGEASPTHAETVLTVKNKGTYFVAADWYENEMPGYITGLTVTSEKGEVIYAVTGGLLKSDSIPMELESGRYSCRLEYLSSQAEYEGFLDSFIPDAEKDSMEEIFKSGTWEMKYTVGIYEYTAKSTDIIIACCGIVMGLLLVALVITLARKDGEPSNRYDERQIAMQGKAYKYGFFTMLGYAAAMIAFMDSLRNYVQPQLMVFLGIAIGAMVMVTYSIMHDAYFRLNESREHYIFFFILMAVVNVGLGIMSISTGRFMEEGQISFIGSSNLVCGIMLAYLLIVLLVKRISDGKED